MTLHFKLININNYMNNYYKITTKTTNTRTVNVPVFAHINSKNFTLANGSTINNPTEEQILNAGYKLDVFPTKPTEVIEGEEWLLTAKIDGDTLIREYKSLPIREDIEEELSEEESSDDTPTTVDV